MQGWICEHIKAALTNYGGTAMYIDERTGNVVYGGSTRGHFNSQQVEEEHWIWKALSIVMFIVWAAIGFNWLDDHYSWGVVPKIKSSFTGITGRGTSSEKSCNDDHTSGVEPCQPPTWTIICCVCNARLDASHLRHLRSFDCSCPNCGSSLHVENQN